MITTIPPNMICPDIVFGDDKNPVLIIRTSQRALEIPEGVNISEAAEEFLRALRDVFGVDLRKHYSLPTGA